MRLEIKLISNNQMRFGFSILSLCSFLVMAGCSTSSISNRSQKSISKSSNQKLFNLSYDLVWRAAQLSLHYPIAVNNMDNGIIETEPIKAVDGFRSPLVEEDPSSGIQYKVIINLVRGKADGTDAVRVTVNKTIERKRDFFTEPEPLESDGLEERVILYRMERELIVDEAIKKAQAKGQL